MKKNKQSPGGVLENFAKFIGERLCWSLFLSASENDPEESLAFCGNSLQNVSSFNQTQALYNLSWCVAHSVLATFLQIVSLLRNLLVIWQDLLYFLSNALADLKKMNCFLFYLYGMFNYLLHSSLKRKYKNENVILLLL